MDERPIRAERRWPMAVAVLTAVVLQVVTPHRGRIRVWWLVPLIEVALLVIIVVQDPRRIDEPSRAARRTTIALIGVMTVATLSSVMVLLFDIVAGHLPWFVAGDNQTLNATNLFGRGAALWVTNVIAFSLWFWEYDRGGPVKRATGAGVPPSFAFPENATPELASEGWTPQYPDYLYLAYTNATAFSPTDTLPVRTWAKMTMMAQSTLSLVIAILVVARAINLL